VEWKNAAPSNLFHVRSAENRLSRLSANDPPVSRNGNGMQNPGAVFLHPGDMLVMHSPGFYNATNEKGETFVHDQFMNSIREGFQTGPRQLTRQIKKDVEDFFKTGLPPFDLVWVALEIVD
jgi:serine phosphatase RsbU (regulator of sigma subunit)